MFTVKGRIVMNNSKYKELFKKNEKTANRYVVIAFLLMFLVLSVVMFLNAIDVFIISRGLMMNTYIICSILLILPFGVNKLFPERGFVKYYNTFTAVAVISILTYTFTYHVMIVAVFPILIANIYFIKRLNRWAISLTVVLSAVMQVLSLLNGRMMDQNFQTLQRLLLYGVLPRTILLLAMAIIFTVLNERTEDLLNSFVEEAIKLEESNERTVKGFANIVESRDSNTGGHIKRTSRYVEAIACKMLEKGIYPDVVNEDFIKSLSIAAPLHDVGKITLPDNVLLKDDKLSDEEFDVMKSHALLGGQMILETFTEGSDYEKMAYEVAMNHHEKWDGSGYPYGKKGEEIPISARIMAVADVFDALSQDRCYRKALSLDECFDIITAGRGKHFDPVVVDVMIEIRPEIEKIIKEL